MQRHIRLVLQIKLNNYYMFGIFAGKYMACCLLYRGDCTPGEINKVIEYMTAKRTVQFVDWVQGAIKKGISGSVENHGDQKGNSK